MYVGQTLAQCYKIYPNQNPTLLYTACILDHSKHADWDKIIL